MTQELVSDFQKFPIRKNLCFGLGSYLKPTEKSGRNSDKGVILFGHGLNIEPASMKFLIEPFLNAGFICEVIHFPGHGRAYVGEDERKGRMIAMRTLLQEDLENTLLRAAAYIRKKYVSYDSQQFHYIGFSLGGLVGLAASCQLALPFGTMHFCAPAFRPYTYAKLVQYLPWKESWLLPSGTPRPFRANIGTPKSLYRVLFRLVDDVDPKLPIGCRGYIYLSATDELISPKATQQFVDNAPNTNQWTVDIFKPKKMKTHLMIDPKTFDGFDKMVGLIESRITL